MEEKSGKGKSSLEFLLKEYERINQLWIHENNQAEHRVTFFLTIFSAAIGIIIYLATAQAKHLSSDDIALSILIVSIILFFFGITTLNRLFMRDLQIVMFRNILKIIEEKLNVTGESTDYFEKRCEASENIFHKSKPEKSSKFYDRLRGTLSDLIVIFLSLISGSLIGSIIILITDPVLAAVITAILFAILSYSFLFFIYKNRIKKKLRPFNYFPKHMST